MIAAIYARKSNDQNGVAHLEKSVTRQIEQAKEYASKKGWIVADEHIYSDDGISGAEFVRRPGFLRLMNALKPQLAFHVLIMSEGSRLGRESIETPYALKQLVTAGVRVFYYLEDRERTLENPTEKLLMSVAAYTDEIERERARQRTYDAMLRKAKAGHVTGGRVFGYDNVTVEVFGPDGSKHRSHVERRINEAEAEVVRRIFTLYAQGRGISAIAKVLNEAHVRCPRPQQGRPKGWAPSSVRAVLLRPLYRGLLVWNQTKKRNMWGVVAQTSRAEDEWVRVQVPHLRIVSDELWDAVEQRFESLRRRSLRTAGGKLLGRPPGEGVKHLLAGLAKCTCGASIEARSRSHGRRRVVFYGCSAYHRKGKSVCANGLTLPANTLEEAVLRSVEEAVLDPRVVEAALDRAVARITCSGDREGRLAELRKALSATEDELERLVEAIAQGGDSKTLTSAVREREGRRDELQFSLDALLRDEWTGPKTNQQVRRDLQARIEEWRGLLRRHPVQGQQILRKLIDGRLTLTPHRDEVVAYYEFEGTGTITGLLAGIVPHNLASPTGNSERCIVPFGALAA